VRSDPEAPKHRGISYLVTPMSAPGLTVRPMLDMAGRGELCEAFFDNVRVPVAYRIGEENRGWYVAMTTLDFERSGISGAVALQQDVLDLIGLAHGLRVGAAMRSELADIYVATEVARLMSHNVASLQDRGLVPNYESSMVKLFTSELSQRVANCAVRLFGQRGALLHGSRGEPARGGDVARNYSGVIPMTIAGGSSEVQRNVIASRGLGLPRG
jgi:alkylation response protein AidB-like acyl-CoA dehydrogenase